MQDNEVEAGMESEVPSETQSVNSSLEDQYLILFLNHCIWEMHNIGMIHF